MLSMATLSLWAVLCCHCVSFCIQSWAPAGERVSHPGWSVQRRGAGQRPPEEPVPGFSSVPLGGRGLGLPLSQVGWALGQLQVRSEGASCWKLQGNPSVHREDLAQLLQGAALGHRVRPALCDRPPSVR